jgi:hypothetical protein
MNPAVQNHGIIGRQRELEIVDLSQIKFVLGVNIKRGLALSSGYWDSNDSSAGAMHCGINAL